MSLLKKKKKEKKVEKKIENLEVKEEKKLEGSAALAQKINSIMRGKQFYILCYISMALKKEVKRRYWNLSSIDELKALIVSYFL